MGSNYYYSYLKRFSLPIYVFFLWATCLLFSQHTSHNDITVGHDAVPPSTVYLMLEYPNEWFDLHPSAASPSFAVDGLHLYYRCWSIWLIVCNITKGGKAGEKWELSPKATSLEVVEDKHHAIYVKQSKAPEHMNVFTSLSCSPQKLVFCGHVCCIITT